MTYHFPAPYPTYNPAFSDLYFFTCKINNIDVYGNIATTGTGFFVNTGINTNSIEQILLVTNKHVININSSCLLIKFHRQKSSIENNYDYLLENFDILIPDFLSRCISHIDNEIDLITLDITDILISNRIYFKYVDIHNIFHKLYHCFIPEPKAYFIGYPKGLIDNANNLPLLSTGIISTHLLMNYDNSSSFIIDATVLRGSSGSPVFIITQNLKTQEYKLTLFGIISMTMTENTEIKKYVVEDIKGYATIYSNLGIGIHADRLLEHIRKSYNNQLSEQLINNNI